MDELKTLLLQVPDSYPDFVEAVTDEALKSEYRKDKLLFFLKDNGNALTSDVLEYLVVDLELYDEYKGKTAVSA